MKQREAEQLLQELQRDRALPQARAEIQAPKTPRRNGKGYRLVVIWRGLRATVKNREEWESYRAAWTA